MFVLLSKCLPWQRANDMDTQGKAERRWEQLEAQRRRARRLNELNVKASQRLHRKSARSALAAFRQKSIDGVSLATTVGMRRGEDDGKEGGGQNEDQKENVERCLPPAEI